MPNAPTNPPGSSRTAFIPGVFGFVAIAALLLPSACRPGQRALHVAVASNFATTLESLVADFKRETGHAVVVISGSTGKHYAQIVNGAPIDIFLAADTLRPFLLDRDGFAVPGSRRTYAEGRLVLWSAMPGFVDSAGSVLSGDAFDRLSIANPELAPYGRAARQVLEGRGLWEALGERIVRGENVAQAFHFIASGNARLGFVALSQVLEGASGSGSYWLVPDDEYDPIEQQMIVLNETPAAVEFAAYVLRDDVRARVREAGYVLR